MSNIDPALETSIFEFVEASAELSLLDAAATANITERVAANFVDDRDVLWWWESLRRPPTVDRYGAEDGLARLRERLEGRAGPFVLVVTDDERPPWVGVRGTLSALVELLRSHQYFEYLIVDDSTSWVLFDTHDNCLVLAGNLGPNGLRPPQGGGH